MPRKPYTVENQRPRRTVSLYGRTLAFRGRGRTSTMDLDGSELLGPACVRLFKAKRLALVRGDMPKALQVLLSDDVEEQVEESVEVVPPPNREILPGEPNEPIFVVPDEVFPEEESSDDERPLTDSGLTIEDVRDLSYMKIKDLAKSMDLKSSGRKAALQDRVIEALGLGD